MNTSLKIIRAEIVSVGTELLLGQIVDTNAVHLAQRLAELGISVYRRVTVGDNMSRLVTALKQALSNAEIVFTIGGLGPTMDDITRDALAEAMGERLQLDPAIQHRLIEFFQQRNVTFPANNLKQALVPERGHPLNNPNGTAPGLVFEKDRKLAIALPGPPSEFLPMVQNEVIPLLRDRFPDLGVIHSRVLRVTGLGESLVEEKIKDLMRDENPTVAPYAKTGEVHLRITARALTIPEAEEIISKKEAQIRERLDERIYAVDDEPLESVVLRLFIQHKRTIAAAESCTGGMLAERLTNIAGSSNSFLGGIVAYSNSAKIRLLNVPPERIESFGAVSAEVAEAMADGVRQVFGSDIGIGITGIAGPGGGTPEKPVGLVYISVAGPDNSIKTTRNIFLGQRNEVRIRATQTALTMLKDRLLSCKDDIIGDG